MKKLIKEKNYYFIIFGLILVSAFTLFMYWDDYAWYFAFSDKRLAEYAAPNGRYFSNLITAFFVHHLPLYSVFYFITFGGLIVLLERLIRNKKVPLSVSFLSVFVLIHFIPAHTYTEIFRWISGFNNYCFAFIFTLVYIIFTFKLLFTDYKPKLFMCVFFLIIGFSGCLCVEHLTIYNILFCLFAVAATYFMKKKLILHHFCFLIGAVIGAVLMFSNSQYHTIATQKDELCIRKMYFSLSDALMQVYRFIAPHFCKDFWLLHILLAVAFTVLYFRSKETNKPKYGALCLIWCWVFVTYLIFTDVFQDFVVLSSAMKIRAIELSLTFLYICALIYNTVVYITGNERIKEFVYLFSALALTLPFAFVSPINARCFFIEYLFWILYVLGIIFEALSGFKEHILGVVNSILTCVACGILILFSNMNITNYYYSNLRFDYIKEQLASKSRYINIIYLPYQNYAMDDFTDGAAFAELWKNSLEPDKKMELCEFIMKYHGISYDDFKNCKYGTIDAIDYNESVS